MSSDDRYRNFAHLTQHEMEEEDYEIEVIEKDRDLRIVVMAPHGGGIEPHTAPLARMIAGEDLSFYAFKGIKLEGGNGILHITSTNFDEPEAIRLARQAGVVIAVHGKSGVGEFAMVGGRHPELVRRIEAVFEELEVGTRDPPSEVAARDPQNLCNRSRQGGVQLELSMELRKRLRSDAGLQDRFVRRIRHLLLESVTSAA